MPSIDEVQEAIDTLADVARESGSAFSEIRTGDRSDPATVKAYAVVAVDPAVITLMERAVEILRRSLGSEMIQGPSNRPPVEDGR